jgi:hypothetical protein
MEKVRHILGSRKASLEALAKRLIEREVIDSDELQDVIEETSSSPLIVPGTAAEKKRHGPPVVEAPLPRECDPAEGSM